VNSLQRISIEEATTHPTRKMGPKVCVDCSTMMNKGLEAIEAHWLFGMEPQKIDIVIHPQSLVQSFVEFCDGALFAQVSEPDMRLPIQYALTYPARERGLLPPFDFRRFGR
jgi:1-deoxy-D-xylulose-5-phosphate reductoisomerase